MLFRSRGVLADPDALAAVQAYQTYLLNITGTYGGSRPTKAIIDLEREASLPPWGSDRATWPEAFKTMRQNAQNLRAKAGRAAPPEDAPPDWLKP